jgi:hypothetical protein
METNKNILAELLKNRLLKLKDRHSQWLFLFNCIKSGGYLKEETDEQMTEEETLFQEMLQQASPHESETFSEQFNFPVLQQSYQEQQQSSINTPFSGRTFIQTDNARMQALQIRTMEQEEVEYNKVKEQISLALNQVTTTFQNMDTSAVLNYAMTLYKRITDAYRNGLIKKGTMKGKKKKGYIFLCLYYALNRFQICLPREQVLVYFNGDIKFSDIPSAEKNWITIFGETSDNDHSEICTSNMKYKLDAKTRSQIQEIVEVLKENFIFSDPATSAEVAAVARYITGKHYKELELDTHISDETIRKNVLKIEAFLGKRK